MIFSSAELKYPCGTRAVIDLIHSPVTHLKRNPNPYAEQPVEYKVVHWGRRKRVYVQAVGNNSVAYIKCGTDKFIVDFFK